MKNKPIGCLLLYTTSLFRIKSKNLGDTVHPAESVKFGSRMLGILNTKLRRNSTLYLNNMNICTKMARDETR